MVMHSSAQATLHVLEEADVVLPLCSRCACGGCYVRAMSFVYSQSSSFLSFPSCQVTTVFYSPTPDVTAMAIAERLALRVQDPNPPGAEECAIM